MLTVSLYHFVQLQNLKEGGNICNTCCQHKGAESDHLLPICYVCEHRAFKSDTNMLHCRQGGQHQKIPKVLGGHHCFIPHLALSVMKNDKKGTISDELVTKH